MLFFSDHMKGHQMIIPHPKLAKEERKIEFKKTQSDPYFTQKTSFTNQPKRDMHWEMNTHIKYVPFQQNLFISKSTSSAESPRKKNNAKSKEKGKIVMSESSQQWWKIRRENLEQGSHQFSSTEPCLLKPCFEVKPLHCYKELVKQPWPDVKDSPKSDILRISEMYLKNPISLKEAFQRKVFLEQLQRNKIKIQQERKNSESRKQLRYSTNFSDRNNQLSLTSNSKEIGAKRNQSVSPTYSSKTFSLQKSTDYGSDFKASTPKKTAFRRLSSRIPPKKDQLEENTQYQEEQIA